MIDVPAGKPVHAFVGVALAGWLAAVFGLLLVQSAAADDGDAFFEGKVRPLLVARCYQCHSGPKTKGGLALDTRSGWQRGGDSGAAIVPGRPDESLLIQAVQLPGCRPGYAAANERGQAAGSRHRRVGRVGPEGRARRA